jgi:hypothetical protein
MHGTFSVNVKEKYHLVYLSRNGKMMLEWISKKQV